ncbi:uncharacterized protein ofcc1 isoform X3 [Betta splendens]|uniref:Uncharacterized protein ofcc1 isoform X3 n=1 Tax=Betta splendens TaxID=158456 RepID=A0A6P7MEQ0_BETSP|nr:uncharacterized protein ofcc1 isoform X3 [Betta splendens]
MDTFGSKLQQKALQQPKQKKSKSAEFLMGREDRAAVVGIENPAFDGGGSAELSVPPVWLGREIRGDRPDSTLAAHQKKMELRAPAKEREQTDPRHRRTAGVSAEDELELTKLNADENRLYQRMTALLDERDAFIDIPGMLVAPRDVEVLEVMPVDPVLQQRLLLHGGGGGGDASSSMRSQAHTVPKSQAEASAGMGSDAGLGVGRTVMGGVAMAEEVIPHYTQQLWERVRPDMITLGSLSPQQQVAEKGPLQRCEWAERKKRPMAFLKGNEKDAARDTPQPAMNKLFQSSRTMKSPSLRALGEGQEEVTATFGQMTELPESSSSGSQPPWQVNLDTTPQPVDVCVRCLRSTRDKLPRGLYTVSVALYSGLGGAPLAQGAKAGQQWAVSTEPVEHRGRVHDTDLHVNQNLFMILPAPRELVPSTVFIFQLIALPASSSHVSSVLAWGAFPACGPTLDLVQGRFRTPLLRSEPNAQLDQFKKIEDLISSDLDHWLCNLYFEVKRLPPGTSGGPERCVTVSVPHPDPATASPPDVHYQQRRGQLPPQRESGSQFHLRPQPTHAHHQHPHAGSGGTAAQSRRASPLHLSADSACSASPVPGKNSTSGAIFGNTGEKSDPCRGTTEGGIFYKKKPIKKTNSCGPSMSGGGGAAPRQPDKHKMQPSMENLSTEEMEEYTFSLKSALTGPAARTKCLSDRARLALRMLPSELGLPLPQQLQQPRAGWRGSVRQLGLIMLLLALMWFARLYLHYCSQWLYLQAIAVPVNKFQFHAHTVDLIYQSSLLHTREELAMVVAGPVTLSAVTFLLVLIRWGCQQIFGSLPSFTSKFIMAQGVWTVLDPLAVFAVDAALGRLTYSPDAPVGDAAKLYWHFHRADQSGAAGVIITLFLYAVLSLLSVTILSIYLLRFHNDGRMLDVYQRLTAEEGIYFVPEDLELSNQELSYIVKKAEQWRGFNGERRKVTVHDYIWAAEGSQPGSAEAIEDPAREAGRLPRGETSTHVAVYTLHLSGLKQRYRHFLRQPDGAIVEVIGDMEGVDMMMTGQRSSNQREEEEEGARPPHQLRKRKKLFGRSHRVEPLGGSGCGSSFALQDLNQ